MLYPNPNPKERRLKKEKNFLEQMEKNIMNILSMLQTIIRMVTGLAQNFGSSETIKVSCSAFISTDP